MWRWRFPFFRVFFVPLSFSLYSMERTSYVRFFLPDGVLCLVTMHGLGFYISLHLAIPQSEMEMSLFLSIFCTITFFSLYGEDVVRTFFPSRWCFLPCDDGLDFYISLPCENSINQSINQYCWVLTTTVYGCVCVCFLPIHSGHQVRWTYQPGSHRRKVTQDF